MRDAVKFCGWFGWALLGSPHPTSYRLVDLVFQQNRVPYTVALEVGSWEVIKQYVAIGLGISISISISIVTAICLTDADRTRLAARSLAKYFPSRGYGVVVRKGRYLSQQARDFIELIQPQMLEPRGYDETGPSAR